MIIAISLDGTLRLRQLNKEKSVVEVRSHLYPGNWTYCVWRNLPHEEALNLFNNQCFFYWDKTRWFEPVVNPGE